MGRSVMAQCEKIFDQFFLKHRAEAFALTRDSINPNPVSFKRGELNFIVIISCADEPFGHLWILMKDPYICRSRFRHGK